MFTTISSFLKIQKMSCLTSVSTSTLDSGAEKTTVVNLVRTKPSLGSIQSTENEKETCKEPALEYFFP